MASLPADDAVSAVLDYSSRYDFPLTASEVWFWQISTQYSPTLIKRSLSQPYFNHKNSFYWLNHHLNFQIRIDHFVHSQPKWTKVYAICQSLVHIPSVQAIFITGTLAMDNCRSDDDIDIMVITSKNTLWLTRFIVDLWLVVSGNRRPVGIPQHSSVRVKDLVCDNLWLDEDFLAIPRSNKDTTHNLYLAHEILQAKPLLDKSFQHRAFIQANSWISAILPIAHQDYSGYYPVASYPVATINKFTQFILKIINLVFFIPQFLFMFPKITSEKISLHQAFFHPRPNP